MKICVLPAFPSNDVLKKIEIKYPGNDTPKSFLYNSRSLELFEVIKFSEKFRSWFVGDYVLQDGSLYIITRVDPILVLSNFLNPTDAYYKDIYHVVNENDVLYKCLTENVNLNLEVIVDVKKMDNNLYVRYNANKIMKFFRYKVVKLNECLKANSIQVSDNFVKVADYTGSKQEEAKESDYIAFSISLIADYVPVKIVDQLFEFYGIKEEIPNQLSPDKKKSNKRKHKSDEPVDDYTKLLPQDSMNKKQKVLTRTEKQLSKVDKTGMKSITSFFQKKTSW